MKSPFIIIENLKQNITSFYINFFIEIIFGLYYLIENANVKSLAVTQLIFKACFIVNTLSALL